MPLILKINLISSPKGQEFPGAELAFSVGNIGLFLETHDALYVCYGEQGTYLLLLRTQQTDPPREGLAEEAATLYIHWAREKTHANILQGMDPPQAINQAVHAAMIEVCKKYNIVLYQGESKKRAQKLI